MVMKMVGIKELMQKILEKLKMLGKARKFIKLGKCVRKRCWKSS